MDPWAQGWIIVHPLQTAYKNLSVSESHKIYIPHRPESSVGGRAKGGCSREQFLDHGGHRGLVSRPWVQAGLEHASVSKDGAVILLHRFSVLKAWVAQWSLCRPSAITVCYLSYV